MAQDTQNFADEEELNQPQTIKEKVKRKSDEPKVIAEKEKNLKQQHNVTATKMTPTKQTASKPRKKKAPDGTVDVIGDDDRSEALMAAISYIPPLFIIPLLARKESDFAQFHAKQAMAMFIILMVYVIIWWVVLSNFVIKGGGPLWMMNFAAKLGFVIIFCIGFVTAFQGKKTKIPPFSLIAEEIKI